MSPSLRVKQIPLFGGVPVGRGGFYRRNTVRKIKPYLLLALSLVPLAAIFWLCVLGQPRDTRPLILRIQFSFTAGGEEIKISPWLDEESGYVFLFLPACAPDDLAVILPGKTELEDDISAVRGSDVLDIRFKNRPEENGKITVMRGGGVGAVFISLPGKSLDYVNEDKANSIAAIVNIIGQDGELQYGGLANFAGRGNSTWIMPKRGYNLKLNEAAGILGMEPGQSWAMLANYYDNSHIRNKLAYDLAAGGGLPFSPHSEYADVYINGDYRGLYLISEKTDRVIDSLRDLGGATQDVNPAPLESYPAAETANIRAYDFRNEPDDVTGGYLLEMDFPYRWDSLPSGFATDRGQYVKLRAPEYASRAQVNYIRELAQNFEDVIYNDPDADLSALIDVDEWARFCLVQEITGNQDAGLSSGFYYKDAGDGRLRAGPVWDMDCVMGNCFPTARYPQGLRAMSGMFYELNTAAFGQTFGGWYAKLYQNAGFRATVERLYRDEFLPLLERMITGDIDSYTNIIRESQAMDELRWAGDRVGFEPLNPPASAGTPDDRAEFIRAFLARRREFLSDLWINHAEYVTVGIVPFAPEERYLFHLFSIRPGETAAGFIEDSISELRGESFVLYDTDEPFDICAPVYEDIRLKVASYE